MILQFDRDDYAKNLPDAYRKDAESNNAKLLLIEKEEADRLREAIAEIDASLDLDQAYGRTLDMYGEMLSQERGKATDGQYRVLIRSRIIRNLAGGDYNSVIKLLAMIFGCEPTDLVLTEPGACVARVDALPYDTLNGLAIDVNTALKVIKELLPAGVALESVNFSGTFEFSGGSELVYDETAGFADIDQTTGGYFGVIFDGSATELPV